MKIIFTLALLLSFIISFSQWTRVEQLPASDIFSLYRKDSILFAGGRNVIYFSSDKGQTWDSTTAIPQLPFVTSIIVYKNELYATAPSSGVYKSPDGGTTWQNISAGIFPDVADFTEWLGDLYATTLGAAVFKLNPVSRNDWLPFSNGVSDLSANTTSIAGNSNALIAGTLGNGLYDYLPSNSATWEERFLLGQISPTEGTYDIITGHDSLFLAGSTGRFYLSTDNGLHWNIFANRLPSINTTIVNARQALLASRSFVNGGSIITTFQYIRKDSLQNQYVLFSVVPDHFTWRLEIAGDKIWDASSHGLFYMSLSDLPGITAADDTVAITPLPVHFVLFNAKCEGDKVAITWKTSQEQNSSRFEIQNSNDGLHWTVIGDMPAAGNSNSEKSYSFNDSNPLQNSYYRVAQYDADGRIEYTGVLRVSCNVTDVLSVAPNPFHDAVFVNILSDEESKATIRIFDNRGALVKVQDVAVLPGSNQWRIDIGSLANGIYVLSAEWNNGQIRKTARVLKQ